MSHHHPENDPQYIGLNVNPGIEKPEAVNADSVKRFLKKGKRRILSPDDYLEGILKGNITILSQAVTLVESNKSEHQKVAQEIIIKCLPYAGNSVRLGITGVPGAGKSTFADCLKNLAWQAIDLPTLVNRQSCRAHWFLKPAAVLVFGWDRFRFRSSASGTGGRDRRTCACAPIRG